VFVLSKPFQSSLLFVSEARAYPSKSLLRCSTLGQAAATNIILGILQ